MRNLHLPGKLSQNDGNTVREFLQMAGSQGLLSGLVLDYGCGRQPYQALVESFGGTYVPYDRKDFPGNVSREDLGDVPWEDQYDAILCTQVVQFIPLLRYGTDPSGSLQNVLTEMYLSLMVNQGHLVMTYPTNWPEDEPGDLHRFTKQGMERLLREAGFQIVEHLKRHSTRTASGKELVHGYGVVARA